ncbi:MAG: hypothetical protein ACLVLZ_11080 [[Clostridium] scindens]
MRKGISVKVHRARARSEKKRSGIELARRPTAEKEKSPSKRA